MATSTILPLSQLSFFIPKPYKISRAAPFRPWKQRTSQPTGFKCHKMYVPGFGEASPEAKAANNLHNFFTYIAVKIVTAQLQVRSAYCKNDFEWDNLERLASKVSNPLSLFSERVFSPLYISLSPIIPTYPRNWFLQMVGESNTRLMRDYVLETTHAESERGQ
ncbi:chaperonin-like RbcX protein [Actinidia rufa]|uniref:Chaperonin-like RbcX protein n=1 Tax=Actinidia rufa TaxID=165716 RepID=A0A7J0G6F2_9ERIC|nr:chaperonin-like RbcX protein [Actinidia rufa]